LIAIEGEEGLSQQRQYDSQGRLTAQLDAAAQKTSYRLNEAGDLIGVSLPDGSQISFERDQRGQISAFSQGGLTQHYRYDRAGRLTVLTNENHSNTSFGYDVMDRLIEQVNFDGRTQRYSYDAAGQLIESQDGSQKSSYRHDEAGRLIERSTEQNDGSQHKESYRYDANGQLIRASAGTSKPGEAQQQQPEAQAHNTVMVEFKRDALGRITAEEQSLVNAGGKTIWRHQLERGFDALGNEDRTTLHGLPELNWQTYGSGHLHGITLHKETLIDFERDKLHRETERRFAGASILKQYDRLSRLQGIRGMGPNAELHDAIRDTINRDHHYDSTGQLTQIDTLQGQYHYGYDKARRLIEASQPNLKSQTYQFDPAGNRLFDDPAQEILSPEQERQRWEELVRKNHDNRNFNFLQPPIQPEAIKAPKAWPSNRIRHDEHYSYTYDGFGNLINKRSIQNQQQEHRYIYDANQRLIRYGQKTEEGMSVNHYFYDPFGAE